MKRTRQQAEMAGRRAENRAALVLKLKGWNILGQRLRNEAGEVDIVARRENLVAFIEVKWRADPAALKDAVDERRLARVAAAAEIFAADYVRPQDDMRIDVMLVAPMRWPIHLENVWMG